MCVCTMTTTFAAINSIMVITVVTATAASMSAFQFSLLLLLVDTAFLKARTPLHFKSHASTFCTKLTQKAPPTSANLHGPVDKKGIRYQQ